jgi:hypothetical protein
MGVWSFSYIGRRSVNCSTKLCEFCCALDRKHRLVTEPLPCGAWFSLALVPQTPFGDGDYASDSQKNYYVDKLNFVSRGRHQTGFAAQRPG